MHVDLLHNDKFDAKPLLKTLKGKCSVEQEAVKDKIAMQIGQTQNSDSVSC